MKNNCYDVLVVGGGAAGLAAALAALCAFQEENKKPSLAILERNAEGGKKLAITGNGRCNVTNSWALAAEYGSADPALARSILTEINPDETLGFFEELGLFCREEEEGRVYPCHGQASVFRDHLVQRTKALGAVWHCGFAVKSVEALESGAFGDAAKAASVSGARFRLVSESGEELFARKVLLAPGGKAGIRTGSQGDGYRWVRTFGHTVLRPHPALVQVTHEDPALKDLKGVRAPGRVTLLRDGTPVQSASGEIQFGSGLLSGICVFDLSGKIADTEDHTYKMQLDFLEDLTAEEVLQKLDLLKNRLPALQTSGTAAKEETLAALLEAFLPVKLAAALAKAGLRKKGSASEIAAALLKDYTLTVTGTKGWVEAQVTAGGVKLSEIDEITMESRLVPGLYLAGELLDANGPCGGFNLQWAWTTGILAGRALAAGGKV